MKIRNLITAKQVKIISLGIVSSFYTTICYAYDANQQITIIGKNNSLRKVFDQIEKQSNLSIDYDANAFNDKKILTNIIGQGSVPEVMAQVLDETNFTYKIEGSHIILMPRQTNSDQEKTKKINGTVSDEKGESIIGANIQVKGASIGTISDIDGNFTLEVPIKATLVVSYIGYQTKEVPITNQTIYKILLVENTELLEEVVVTALGIKREEKALGYSVQKVSGESLANVKSVDVATNLTGKVAGLNVKNSTEFNEAPSLSLRGETPLLVIDGVPYNNLSLRDVAPDDIESIDVLKGATASALYGARGGSGAVMVTTKRGNTEGLAISINSSTMFNAGYLRQPEVQTSYSSGTGGKYRTGDYVWGDKMDIGREALQHNPYTYEWEMRPLVSKGKNNLENFQENGFVTNNNINVTQKGKYGSFRTSLTHVYNKGQWPNEKLNKLTYAVSGEMSWNKFSLDAGITYNKRFYPNKGGTGYGGGGYLYNLLVWSGTDFDIRDYKNYWQKEDELSNWMDRSWYENPYLIANEITSGSDYDVVNGFANINYDIKPWLKFVLRSGMDVSSNKTEYKTPVGSVAGWGGKKGYYSIGRNNNFSINNDALLMADYKWGDFSLDGFLGGTIYYQRNDDVSSATKGGLIIPGYYSLNASVDPATTSKSYSQKQVNSIYGKFSGSWKSTFFVDVTGRNDWSSTLPESTRSYFYPSIAGSIVLSEFIPLPDLFNFWKVRGSWTVTKQDMSIYAINQVYSISTNVWNDMTGAYSPNDIKDAIISPATSRSYELGTAFNMLQNRLKFDFAYYNKLNYNNSRYAGISPTTGYTSTLINIEEEQLRKGFEVTLSGSIIQSEDIEWNATFNWSKDRYYYNKIDPIYSTQKPWVASGARWDWLTAADYQRDPQGNIIHGNDGMPLINPVATLQGYTSPDWIWGFSTSLRYKNFTLDVSFDGRVGGIAHAVTDQAMWNSGAHIDSDNQYRYDEVVNGNKTYVGQGVKVVSGSADWDSDGNIIRDDRVYAPNDKTVSYEVYTLRTNPYIGVLRTQNLLNQSFFKLRNLAINYRLPETVCQKVRLKGVMIGFVGQNLWMWTKDFRFSDPDKDSDNLNSPSSRYLGFNVKLDF